MITIYVDEKGKYIGDDDDDGIWNFHVWTEVWMKRPDLLNGDGWQIVDGTPQVKSRGKYQCGPASQLHVKGNRGGNHDVDFVYAEVSAPVRYVEKNQSGELQLRRISYDVLGRGLITKKYKSSDFLDLKDDYRIKR